MKIIFNLPLPGYYYPPFTCSCQKKLSFNQIVEKNIYQIEISAIFLKMLEMQESKAKSTKPIKTKATKSTNKSKKPTPKANHPPVAVMVKKAVETLSSKKGCSVVAIKKYLAANYMVDPDKLIVFIKKFLGKAVENKVFIQTTGKGCTGSFKLAREPSKIKKPAKSHVTARGTKKQTVQKLAEKVKKSSSKSKTPTSKQTSKNDAKNVQGHKRTTVLSKDKHN
ncbi:hypothetical protein HUJ05_010123 [Dendroctonus ponderosae]|nr:hypothetical protein HUJ05_010123 [Dendroctonus ponderosae]